MGRLLAASLANVMGSQRVLVEGFHAGKLTAFLTMLAILHNECHQTTSSN